MATILNTSIDLTKIPKNKIIDGKKGKYLPITVTINDELDNYGNKGTVTVSNRKKKEKVKLQKFT